MNSEWMGSDDGWMDSKKRGINWDPWQPYNTHHLDAKAPRLSQVFVYTASRDLLLFPPPFCGPHLNILRDACDLPHFLALPNLLTTLSGSISHPLKYFLFPVALIPSFLWSRTFKAILQT